MRSRSINLLVILAVFLSLLGSGAFAMPAQAEESSSPVKDKPSVNDDWGRMPLYFIANQGQMDERVAYYVQGSDKMLYFASDGVTFALSEQRKAMDDRERSDKPKMDGKTTRRWIVKLDFVDANATQPSGQAQTGAKISYFTGAQEDWHTGTLTYSQIVYRELWEGIDLTYSGTVNQLKHEFIVQPGADPSHIRLAYRGASVHVNEAGQLEVRTPAGSFQDAAPIAYQEVNGRRVPVTVSFELDKAQGVYGFRLGAYDRTLPLVIDPIMLVYCGFIGGSGYDYGNGIAVDAAGNTYISGITYSTEADFPVTVGPDLTRNSSMDAFVAKVNASGTALVYAGYIGGNGDDRGSDIAVDAAGNAYITGTTYSTEASFPVTGGPDLTHNGISDAFVAKVNVGGTDLVYLGYIGGSGEDYGNGIAVDAAGNAYIIGATYSTEASFPVTGGPDLTYNGFNDAFVAKVNAGGTALDYAGYIGGISTDVARGIAVDAAGNAYITGYTRSDESTFPVTGGPDLIFNGDIDAFIAKVNAGGTALDYAGYIGGSGSDFGNGIVVDAVGNAYITGQTASTEADFPVTGGPDLIFNGNTDAFIAKVNAGGTALDYAGYIGGSSTDAGNGIAVDAVGNAYITGYTPSDELTFPVTGGPDLIFNGNTDAFIAKVNAGGTALDYAGYIGGSGNDYGNGIVVDAVGNAYITGQTASTEATFPVTGGPDLTYNGGVLDAFVAEVTDAAVPPPPTGITFGDVPVNYWAWQYIEAIYNAGITGGCNTSPMEYCPTDTVTRAQMAVFLLRGIHGRGYIPPTATGAVFGDVPADLWSAKWIEQLSAEGLTNGCGDGNYCPDAVISRAEMSIFLLRAKYGKDYVPPTATGAIFADVPAEYWAAGWIEQLLHDDIAKGCGNNSFCPDGNVSRDQMAVFLQKTFNLSLP